MTRVGVPVQESVTPVEIEVPGSGISSASFTEAAHARNIEAGVRLDDAQMAQALRIQFESLRERGLLRAVPGL